MIPPRVPSDRTHVYHHFRFKVDPAAAGVDLPPGVFRKALQGVMAAEGLRLTEYQNQPVPGQRLFQERTGYGKGCPWTCGHAGREIAYDPSAFPNTLEVIRSSLLVGGRLCMASFMEPGQVELMCEAFRKVFRRLDGLVDYARSLEYREPWQEAARLW